MKKTVVFFTLVSIIASCQNSGNVEDGNRQDVNKKGDATFNGDVDGKLVALYSLKNKNNVEVLMTNYGARIVGIKVPDREGKLVDVVLGYDDAASYKKHTTSFYGALIGRYGNRIAKGKFSLNGEEYQLEVNDGENSLHGGKSGFYDKVWDVEHEDANTLTLSYTSPDGEGGYPGTLKTVVTYHLNDENGLEISYSATTDKSTVVNLTNHAFFNLNGEGDSSILDHVLTIHASAITGVDEALIPTGELLDVSGTPFDFRTPTPIGERINESDEQLKRGGGYDHNYVLDKEVGLQNVATVYSPKTGIVMDVLTEEPGLQFYSGNFMKDEGVKGKQGTSHGYRSAFCLETQHFPDSPNQPSFPSTTLNPGETYETTTVYKFSTIK
ncbi:MAG TPA: aldose epimerase family protein [Sphingobacteriaceae bacterium]|nr:aldose epimerase family protein [Sphingobacteriaceae bacterium]